MPTCDESRKTHRNQIMLKIKDIPVAGYEKVIHATDEVSGLNCFIAIHSTRLGPALGGTRIYPYASEEEAMNDVLRLSKAMTYKSALIEDGLGGGKAVIIGHPKGDKSKELFHAFGEAINSLEGKFITAEDVGTNVHDMKILKKTTPYVVALDIPESSGDPSRFTARGVFLGIRSVAKTLWGNTEIYGKKIAVQGLGNVGSKVCRWLFWEGADLVVSDIDEEKTHALSFRYEAEIVPTDRIHAVECDIFSPCALGGIINKKTIPELQCQGIAGAANNQLLEPDDANLLKEKGILYAPDFVINAGGIINASAEFEPEGYSATKSRDKVDVIYPTLLSILEKAKKENHTTNDVAIELAEYKLSHNIGKRTTPIVFA